MYDAFREGYDHGEVFSLRDGIVIESAIESPHNSFYENNEYYALTLEFSSEEYVDEIERIFRSTARHTHLPHQSPWRISKYSIRATSLIKPKRNGAEGEELTGWGEYDIRVKTQLNVGQEAVIEEVLLVMVSDLSPVEFTDENSIDI